MLECKTMAVAAIKEGTVIDHIRAGAALKVLAILRLSGHAKRVSVGLNLPSQTLGIKDLIKVEEKELAPFEANQVAIFAPNATISIITGYEVVKKFPAALPDLIENALACPNSFCITNHERMESKHRVLQKIKNRITLECYYCKEVFIPH